MEPSPYDDMLDRPPETGDARSRAESFARWMWSVTDVLRLAPAQMLSICPSWLRHGAGLSPWPWSDP